MTIRRKNDRVIVSGSVSRSSSRRLAAVSQTSSTVRYPEKVAALIVSYGSALAAVHATEGADRTRAKRARRNARYRLGQLVGADAVDRYTSALEMDGGLFLRAVHAAPSTIREHALQSALNGAQTALEHQVQSRAALTMLTRSTVWQALASAYQHESLRLGGDEAFDKRAAMCGQQARLDLIGALELARSPMVAAMLEPEVDEDALYANALRVAEAQSRAAGLLDGPTAVNDDEDEAPGSPGGDSGAP